MTATTVGNGTGPTENGLPAASENGSTSTEQSLDRVLERLSEQIEPILRGMPAGRLEARRLITRELGSEPRPELLQTIVGIAQDVTAAGVRRELPRRLLATYVLADRELRDLFATTQLDPKRLAGTARTLPQLVELSRSVEDEVGTAIEGLAMGDRDYLLHVADSLTLPQETLVAAALLAPRLELLVRHAREGNLRQAVPSLDDGEVELFLRAAGRRGGEMPSRVILDAIALRTIIDEDLTEWNEIAEANADRPLSPELRQEFHDRLARNRTGYHVISDRLQKQQDAALVADLDRFAEEMREAQRRLFSTYLKLAPTLRSVADTGTEREERVETRASAPAVGPQREPDDRLFAEALKGLQRRDAPEEGPSTAEKVGPKPSRTRLYVLLGIAALLIVGVALAYTILPTSKPATQELTPADFTQALFLEEIVPAGPLVYAKVKRWAWDSLEKRQRLQRVALLGDLAARRGYEAVYLVDETGEQVASWTEYSGTKITPPR
jgi:hypothetical protein